MANRKGTVDKATREFILKELHRDDLGPNEQWDGMGDSMVPRRKNPISDNEWYSEFFIWGRKVRRDILILERFLETIPGGNKLELYGDPGDPPPPIE